MAVLAAVALMVQTQMQWGLVDQEILLVCRHPKEIMEEHLQVTPLQVTETLAAAARLRLERTDHQRLVVMVVTALLLPYLARP